MMLLIFVTSFVTPVGFEPTIFRLKGGGLKPDSATRSYFARMVGVEPTRRGVWNPSGYLSLTRLYFCYPGGIRTHITT